MRPVTLDWREYWNAFKQAHGGDPVNWRGVLLFRDGWTHAAKDLEGPEWPPPEDPEELRLSKLAYWTIRLAILRDERDQLRQLMKELRQVQASRSAPLKQAVWSRDEEGKRIQVKGDLSLRDMEELRLVPLEMDVEAAKKMIDQLNKEAAHGRQKQVA